MKIGEIEATKGKSGNYYGVDEILGMDIEILEDISSNTEIREYKTKKENLYYCVKIRHTEEKDLHLTKAALLAVATVLPKTESWNNYKIKINRTGKGFNTAYSVMVLGKGVSGNTAQPQTPSQNSALIKEVLDSLRWGMTMFPGGVIPENNTIAACKSEVIFQELKAKGLIHNINGGWTVT